MGDLDPAVGLQVRALASVDDWDGDVADPERHSEPKRYSTISAGRRPRRS